jgi:hypothetical protein
MRSAIPGTVIGIILATFMLVIAPLYYIGIVEWARSQSEVMSDTTELVDKVVDTRVLTEDMRADFNLALASKVYNYRATIMRETKIINPDPLLTGETYTTYVVTDNLSEWEQGDIITVEVEETGGNMFRVIAQGLLGLNIDDNSFRFTARIR